MQRGEACTYVYKGRGEARNRLVASFHCVHVERAKVSSFTFRTLDTAPGVMELREFQFAGETAGHAVPSMVVADINMGL